MSGHDLEAILSVGAVRYGDNLTDEELNTNTRLDKLENQNAGERLSALEDANVTNDERITSIEELELGGRVTTLEENDATNTLKIKSLEDINADKRISILEKNTRRLFKPAFGVCQWWITTDKSTGRYTCVSEQRIKADIDKFANAGIEEMSLCVHIGLDKNTSEWYMIHSGANILMAYNYCKSKGIRCNTLKFMVYDSTARTNIKPYWGKFKNFLKTRLNSYCTYLSSQNCKFDCVTALNECTSIYNDADYTSDVSDLLNTIQQTGYKAGLSFSNAMEFIKAPSLTRNKIDVVCINLYPTITYNGKIATIEEGISGWDKICLELQSIRERFPDKPIIITETGCQDRWEALIAPGRYNWTTDYDNTSHGKAPAFMLKTIFESKLKEYVSSINWWYEDSLFDSNGKIFDSVKETLKDYIPSDKY